MERRVGGKRGGDVEMLEKEEEEGRKDRAREQDRSCSRLVHFLFI